MPKTAIFIPARMAAERLPGKPLADIHGLPMILHVWQRAVHADAGPVYVAAGDREIVDVVEKAGGKAILTDPKLPSGTDRVYAALEKIDPKGEVEIVVNIQGDQPTLDPEIVKAVLTPFENPVVDIATPVVFQEDGEAKKNQNVVKAILAVGEDKIHRALYFTRAHAPFFGEAFYYHLGVYAYRRAALKKFVSLPPSALEKQEKLEQLRAMEAGLRIEAVEVNSIPVSVDTPADLEKARKMLAD